MFPGSRYISICECSSVCFSLAFKVAKGCFSHEVAALQYGVVLHTLMQNSRDVWHGKTMTGFGGVELSRHFALYHLLKIAGNRIYVSCEMDHIHLAYIILP